MEKIKPFLKWPGNKYHCIDKIIEALPEGKRLIEPFAGSGAVFVNANYQDFVLAEDNLDLINLYKHLQQEGDRFIKYCGRFFSEQTNQADNYYQERDRFNQCKNPRLRAAIFLYLNRHGYNGLCRYNLRGGYNVPFGRHKKPYFPAQEMQYFAEKSKHAVFIHSDFRHTFKMATAGDIIYCDPPYAPLIQQSNFTSYTQNKFGKQEQIALTESAINATKCGITVIISNHDTDYTRQLYRTADIYSFPVRRSINRHPEKRRPVQELLAIFRGN
jgi:DNA adenine methylase